MRDKAAEERQAELLRRMDSEAALEPGVYRKRLSPSTLVELAERAKDERPGSRLGDQFHGPWCESIHEENRWWEVFVSVLNPAARPWLREKADAEIGLNVSVESAAAVADVAVAVARDRGRL